MHVYVDESGDPGLKVKQGSSKYFVVALVVFEDEEMAEKAGQRIALLRTELHLHPAFEFKFNKCTKEFRLAFLRAVAPYNFFYYGICINKAGLYGEGFKYKEPFYKYASQLAFLNARGSLDAATVFIDGSGDRTFRQQLEAYLKKRINQEKNLYIKDIRIVNSANNNLIQMVDMVAGAINRSLGTKADSLVYRKVIRDREMQVQIWPKEIKKPKS